MGPGPGIEPETRNVGTSNRDMRDLSAVGPGPVPVTVTVTVPRPRARAGPATLLRSACEGQRTQPSRNLSAAARSLAVQVHWQVSCC